MGCVIFDDSGRVLARTQIVAGGCCPAIVIEPGEWHTIVALSETALLLEAKAGPFDPGAAKEMAPWAAEEDDAFAGAYLETLQRLFD